LWKIGSYNTEYSVENFHFAAEQEFSPVLKLEISQNSQEANLYYLKVGRQTPNFL